MITCYIYHKDTGKFLRSDIGNPEYVMYDLQESEDFTLTEPPDMWNSWKWDGARWVEYEDIVTTAPDIDEQIELNWLFIKRRRYKATVSGVYVASIDKVFHTDDVSVIQYNNIGNMIALGIYEPIQWKVMDNTWITMTEEVFKELQKAMVQNTNRIYQVAEEHKAKMMESDNPEEYDYSTGWEVSVS